MMPNICGSIWQEGITEAKSMFYVTMIRRACFMVQNIGHQKEVMFTLYWIYGHIRKDRAQNDDIRERLGVIEEKFLPY
jgi:hypothetical protein